MGLQNSKSNLVDAYYDWLVDLNKTPYIVLNTSNKNVQVPQDFVKEDRIVLNVSPEAVTSFSIIENWLEFSASFSGINRQIIAPINAVVAIYAQEDGEGAGG